MSGGLVSVTGVYRGPYASGTFYRAKDIVLQSGALYSRKADGTPAGAFSAGEWDALPTGGAAGAPGVGDPLLIAGDYSRRRSAAARAIEAADGLKWTERWADRASWSGHASVGLVSAGALFANPAFGPSGYTLWRALPAASGRHRIVGQFRFVQGSAFFQLKAGVICNTGTPSQSALDATALAVGIQNTDGTSAVLTGNSGSPAGTTISVGTVPGSGRLPSGTYQYYIDIDDDWVVITMTDSAGHWMYGRYWQIAANQRPTHVFVMNLDARGSAGGGSSIGPIVATQGNVTVPGSTVGIEDGAPKLVNRNIETYAAYVAYPTSYDTRKQTPVVIYEHGAGSQYLPQSDANYQPIQDAVLAKGWIFASGLFGASAIGAGGTPVDANSGFYNWGSPVAIQALLDLYKYIREHVSLGPILFYAVSMGGLVSLSTIARRQMPGIAGWAGVQPVCSLADMFSRAQYKGHIKTIYSFSLDADYATATAGYDPMLRSAGELRGLPMRFYASPSDTIVPKANNTDLMAAKMSVVSVEASVYATTGEHGNASHFTSTVADDIIAFYDRCLLATA